MSGCVLCVNGLITEKSQGLWQILSVSDRFIQIEVARVVSHSTFELLKRRWEGPEARMQFNCGSVYPASHSIPPTLCLLWRRPKMAAGPLKSGHYKHIVLIEPKTSKASAS